MKTAISHLMILIPIVLLAWCCGNAKSKQESSEMSKEQIFELVDTFEMEMNNGGLNQFFFNSSGDNYEETIHALRKIGANHTAHILIKATKKFPGEKPAKNRELRQNQLEKIDPDDEIFQELDSDFLEYVDDIESLLKKSNG